MQALRRPVGASRTHCAECEEPIPEARLNPQPYGVEGLTRLAKTVGELSTQADGLLVMMLEREAPDEMIDTAGTLTDFFEHAKDQLSRRMVRQT